MITKFTRIVVAASLAIAFTVIAGGTAGAAGTWQWFQLDGDRCWDAAALDADGNGNFDQIWFDIDNDCRLDTSIFNTVGGDSLLEWVSFDMNEDGRPEMWAQDTNQRVGFEWVHFDNNADGRIDSTRSISMVLTSPTFSGQANLILTIAALNGTVVW